MEIDTVTNRVMEIFSTYGVRTVSMDFIAQNIPIRKRELLAMAKNKEGLILHIFNYRKKLAENLYVHITKETTNAIDTLLKMSTYIYKSQHEFKPMLDFEFKKYYPDLYSNYQQSCEKEFTSMIRENIECGICEGMYRQDLNSDITTHLYLEKIRMLQTQMSQTEMNWKPHKIFTEALINHIRGISTITGINYFESKKHTIQHLLDD
ncbi:MAG: hypothetical protein R6U95_03145 [Bacteroidales bacterium]